MNTCPCGSRFHRGCTADIHEPAPDTEVLNCISLVVRATERASKAEGRAQVAEQQLAAALKALQGLGYGGAW